MTFPLRTARLCKRSLEQGDAVLSRISNDTVMHRCGSRSSVLHRAGMAIDCAVSYCRGHIRKAMTVISESPRGSFGGSRTAAVHEAHATYDGAVATHRQSVLTAFQKIEDRLSSCNHLQEQARWEKNEAAGRRLQISVGRKPTCVRRDSARTVDASRAKTFAA